MVKLTNFSCNGPIACTHIAYRIRAAHNVFASHIAFARPITYCILHIAYYHNRAVRGESLARENI